MISWSLLNSFVFQMVLPKRYPIDRDYDVSPKIIGIGGFGKVFRCIHKQTRKKCAVKVTFIAIHLHSSEKQSPSIRDVSNLKFCSFLKIVLDEANARREIDLHYRASQNCPYIVKIEDVYENTFEDKNSLLIVMEL